MLPKLSTLTRAAALILMCAGPAAAGEGQTDLLLNPAATTTITEPGSYVLVADVTMTADVVAIRINADNVVLDLNGHTLTGVSQVGGIGVSGSGSHVTVMNGTIENFSDTAVYAPHSNWTLRRITARNNRVNGFFLNAPDAVVEDCVVTGNCSTGTGAGIWADAGATIRRCVVTRNITVLDGGYVYGIRVLGENALIEDNICTENSGPNAGYGIVATGRGTRIIGNRSSGNSGDYAYGIAGGGGALISDNICQNNAGNVTCVGLYAGDSARFTGNNGSFNRCNGEGKECRGIQAGSNCQIVDNICSGNIGGPNGTGIGILAFGQGGRIAGNTCMENSANGTNFSAFGIQVDTSLAIVSGNACRANNGGGTGLSIGIYALGKGNRIEGNNCGNHVGSGASGLGIYANQSDAGNTVILNTTTGNASNGILLSDGNYRAGNLHKDGASGGTAGSVPGGPDTGI